MNNPLRILGFCLLMFLGGCQVNHTLPAPTLNHELTLPQVSVQTLGPIPGTLIRNHLRSVGVFEQVRGGFDPGGYNIQVLSVGDYYGFSNIPTQFLSAFSLFIIPASVSWDSELVFRVTRGQEEVATYRIDNRTTHYNGLFVHPDGRDDNIRRIIDNFAARVQADAALFKLTPLKPMHTPMPVAPATLQQRTALTVSYEVHADGTVRDVTVTGDAPELARSAVQETVRTWRYEPWTASPEAPATQRTSQRMILKPQSMVRTQEQSCAQVIQELQTFEQTSPGKPTSDLSTFQQTSALLFLTELRQQNSASATEVDKAFARALPWIIDQCRANPQAEYWQYVHEGVRQQRAAAGQTHP
ncbi:hypothetical protein DNK06_10580 [Pseudomonas daroniae]|uniref:TonB C-terminal domain-containing protein n=1 Tax=Phytopseudomonas daroniae TaxID=2487519 RepID=A0A4Q9QMQ6_9GAMM|nr:MULTISPECIES: energy transducer TonB [Pseudomonas]TBU80214.1 hypothetical protein DNK06_10580 [Pseudomonas daroniae]TBU85356.1 hypothetical protein DNK31_03170 [Pseudomonas sp. FRB 228]TBU94203.1 hypothetical protein DNJ99_03170 [Pseudomonas daroniae]